LALPAKGDGEVTLVAQPELRSLSMRDGLGEFLTARGLTGKFVEVGVLFGSYSEVLLRTWRGQLYCVDPWVNQPESVYHDGANKLNMQAVFAQVQRTIGKNPRCTLLRMMSLNAVGKFEDGELDGVYLDGNHALESVRAEVPAWWPKVKIGGIISGHDFFTRYDRDTNSDAQTAVMELANALGVYPHVTWCCSWFFIKTKELDERFRRACIAGELPRPVYTDNRGLDAVIVLPVARFDWNLALKNLKWIRSIGCAQPIIAYCTHELTDAQRDELAEFATVVIARHIKEVSYFGTPNQMFKGALEYAEREHPGKAMLWLEADAIPLRATWVDEIMAEYRDCGRPFLGDVQKDGDIPHLSGNAVYHPSWRKLAPSLAALGQEECGWDSLCAHDLLPRSHHAKTIQQIWRPPLPITAAWAAQNIRPETALFHQCKDGSLIDVLCDRAGIPRIPLAPALCASTYDTQKRAQPAPPAAVGRPRPTRVQQVQAKHAMQPPRFDGKGRRVG
jgi:Methyltransferase domain